MDSALRLTAQVGNRIDQLLQFLLDDLLDKEYDPVLDGVDQGNDILILEPAPYLAGQVLKAAQEVLGNLLECLLGVVLETVERGLGLVL